MYVVSSGRHKSNGAARRKVPNEFGRAGISAGPRVNLTSTRDSQPRSVSETRANSHSVNIYTREFYSFFSLVPPHPPPLESLIRFARTHHRISSRARLSGGQWPSADWSESAELMPTSAPATFLCVCVCVCIHTCTRGAPEMRPLLTFDIVVVVGQETAAAAAAAGECAR